VETFRLAGLRASLAHSWIATKLAVVGLACVVVTGLFSLMVTWWASPFDAYQTTFPSHVRPPRHRPHGYAAFAFALGVTAGAVIRRTLPAMAATLVAYAGSRGLHSG